MAPHAVSQPGLFIFNDTDTIPNSTVVTASMVKPFLRNVTTLGAGIETVMEILQDHDVNRSSNEPTFFNENQIGKLQALAGSCARLMTEQAHDLISRLEKGVH